MSIADTDHPFVLSYMSFLQVDPKFSKKSPEALTLSNILNFHPQSPTPPMRFL